MCTILLAWHCLSDADFILAANRDELVARPSAPPQRLHDSPPIFGGRDLLAGGTWLAATTDGRVGAVTNRRSDGSDEVQRDPTRRSRGELPVALLVNEEAGLTGWLERLRPTDYNPFNILAVSASAAIVGHGGGGDSLPVVHLTPGVHVLCIHDIDDTEHDKEIRLRQRLGAAIAGDATAAGCIAAMKALLSDHQSDSGDGRDAACIHDDVYGTVSSSLLAMTRDGGFSYRHAAGRPCVAEFLSVALDDTLSSRGQV